MMQIIHDGAPGAGQAFHTAFGGQADFALGIQELAGCPVGSEPGCTPGGVAADVIVDDVIYFSEPMFQDGIIAQAVDHVAGAGVSYFSSAGNYGGIRTRPSFVWARPVPRGRCTTLTRGLASTHVRPSRFRQGQRSSLSSGPNRSSRPVASVRPAIWISGCFSQGVPLSPASAAWRRTSGTIRSRSSASPTPEDRSPSDFRSPIRRGHFRGA